MARCQSGSITLISTHPAVQADLLAAAKVKVANSDVYSVPYATFVETFARVMGYAPTEPLLFH